MCGLENLSYLSQYIWTVWKPNPSELKVFPQLQSSGEANCVNSIPYVYVVAVVVDVVVLGVVVVVVVAVVVIVVVVVVVVFIIVVFGGGIVVVPFKSVLYVAIFSIAGTIFKTAIRRGYGDKTAVLNTPWFRGQRCVQFYSYLHGSPFNQLTIHKHESGRNEMLLRINANGENKHQWLFHRVTVSPRQCETYQVSVFSIKLL